MKVCSNRVHRIVGAVLLMVALAACTSAQKAPQQAASATFEGQPPSGFVDMKEVQVAFEGNAGGGEGTLTYQGQRYPFKIAGLGVGGIGVSEVDAEGEVYRLTDLKQFPGFYEAAQYGAVAGTESVGDIWLENPNNVVLHLKAKREGLMLSVGADFIDIHMSQ
jgi:hypothetical protein